MSKFKSASRSKTRWLEEFYDSVALFFPEFAPRIDWDFAYHLFFQGYSSSDAAVKYCASKTLELFAAES